MSSGCDDPPPAALALFHDGAIVALKIEHPHRQAPDSRRTCVRGMRAQIESPALLLLLLGFGLRRRRHGYCKRLGVHRFDLVALLNDLEVFFVLYIEFNQVAGRTLERDGALLGIDGDHIGKPETSRATTPPGRVPGSARTTPVAPPASNGARSFFSSSVSACWYLTFTLSPTRIWAKFFTSSPQTISSV